jgi:hypothetical protein
MLPFTSLRHWHAKFLSRIAHLRDIGWFRPDCESVAGRKRVTKMGDENVAVVSGAQKGPAE